MLYQAYSSGAKHRMCSSGVKQRMTSYGAKVQNRTHNRIHASGENRMYSSDRVKENVYSVVEHELIWS